MTTPVNELERGPSIREWILGSRTFRIAAYVAAGWLLLAGRDVLAVDAVDSIGITVSDLDRAVAFYSDVIGFREEKVVEVDGDAYEKVFGVFGMRLRIARMRLGDEHIELMQFLAPSGRPIPVDSRSNDLWFQHIAIITTDMDRAYRILREHKVAHASSGPQRLPDWNPNAGGIKAFYFRDPDGNHLEILQFPPGKGADKWHAKNAKQLFLGIDHTAIVVSDTDASLRFYRDLLKMQVAGNSENHGSEQERLNNVFGARLLITALRASRGPGVEFLEYLAPSGGRAMPTDTRASDLWHWQINLESSNVAADWEGLRRGKARFVSPGPVTTSGELGFHSGLMVRDPDGHASLLQQRAR
jgi:catechol 2,3-dioxygenase-like lactoylglutathione lyase family enzyme